MRYKLEVLRDDEWMPSYGSCNISGVSPFLVVNALLSQPDLKGARIIDTKTKEVIHGRTR